MCLELINSLEKVSGLIWWNVNLIKILILDVLIRGMDRKLVTNQQKNRSIINTVKFYSSLDSPRKAEDCYTEYVWIPLCHLWQFIYLTKR